MIDAQKMANIENTDKYAKLAPLPASGGQCPASVELQNRRTSFDFDFFQNLQNITYF
jgi:hypothetical protein